MDNPAHLTDDQWNRYRSRTLTPEELLEVDEHLSLCEACQDRASQILPYSAPMRTLRAELTAHFDYEQIVACAEGRASAGLEGHLAMCKMCRAEVADLRQFLTELQTPPRISVMKRRWWVLAAVAAAVVIAAGLSFWSARSVKSVPIAESPLSPGQRQALALATSSHRLERAAILDRLIRQRGELLGAPPVRAFRLAGPLGTVVLTDRPVFRWNPLPGATNYVVSVFDENFDKVTESPALAATEWQPEMAFSRGRVYLWQVTARSGRETLHAPMPPDPEARFEIADEPAVAEIESARRDHPGNHLLLAALYAKDGDLDDAAKELDALAATAPADAAALRTSLARIRGQ